VYLTTKIAMAVGRDLRAAVFATVQRLSVREVGVFTIVVSAVSDLPRC
jgi:hypothetical protein